MLLLSHNKSACIIWSREFEEGTTDRTLSNTLLGEKEAVQAQTPWE